MPVHKLVVKYEKPHWRVERDGKLVASLKRLADARSRARELARQMTAAGHAVTITVFRKNGAHCETTEMKSPAAQARPVPVHSFE